MGLRQMIPEGQAGHQQHLSMGYPKTLALVKHYILSLLNLDRIQLLP